MRHVWIGLLIHIFSIRLTVARLTVAPLETISNPIYIFIPNISRLSGAKRKRGSTVAGPFKVGGSLTLHGTCQIELLDQISE